MDLLTSLIAILACIFGLVLWLLVYSKRNEKYPPGPSKLIIIKNLRRLAKYPHLVISQWAREYGPVLSLTTGISNDMIIINDVKLVKELFAEASSSGRDQSPIITSFGGGVAGIVNNEGPHWDEQRRFTMRTLRDLGLGTSLEGLIMDEVNGVLTFFDKRVGQTIPGKELFKLPVINSLWNIVAGERLDWDVDPPPQILLNAQQISMAVYRIGTSGLYFAPWLRHIAPGFFGFTTFLNVTKELLKSTKVAIKDHISTLIPESPRDFIDKYLNQIKLTRNTNSSFYSHMGNTNLEHVIFDLFFAGTETTSSTLSWILYILSVNPKIQEKIKQEIDTVVGSTSPNLSDRSRLPYCQAVILETLRYATVFPLGGPHRMLQDVIFHGHLLPKGCIILSNLYGIHRNPDYWDNPDEFMPERFLVENGTQIVCPEAFLPFSSGKRMCIGDSLAKDTLFLFLTNIFQKFKVSRDPNSSQGIEEEPGLMLVPKAFKVFVAPAVSV